MRLPNQYENMISMTTLDYIEQKYRTATLTELCGRLHLPMHVLSKMIKKSTGFNFKELLQRKRLNKAVELMCETDLPVSDIIAAVGDENNSYFHRVFKEHYHMTPRAFRVKNSEKERGCRISKYFCWAAAPFYAKMASKLITILMPFFTSAVRP